MCHLTTLVLLAAIAGSLPTAAETSQPLANRSTITPQPTATDAAVRLPDAASPAPKALLRRLAPLRGSQVLDATGTWVKLSQGDPPPILRIPEVIFDPVRRRLLALEGGYQNGSLTVWILSLGDSPQWSVLTTAGTPPFPRYGPSVIYDPVRDRLVLFGGAGYNDVYTLTLGSDPTWQPVATVGGRPELRGGHSAIYDPVRDRMIVFGGDDGSGDSASAYLADTWALSLATNQWTQLASTGGTPPARAWHRAIYDPEADRMILIGGQGAAGARNDTWALPLADGGIWASLNPEGTPPSARYGFGAAFDSERHRVLIHGGFAPPGYRGDLWSLTLTGSLSWSQVATLDTLEGRTDHGLVYDAVRDRLVAYGGFDSAASWDQTATFPLAGPLHWDRFLPPAVPVVPGPRTNSIAVLDALRDRVVVMGGAMRRTDVPLWSCSLTDSIGWAPILTAGAAPQLAAAFVDSASDRVVGFDGSDVWQLSLESPTAWSRMDAQGLSPRTGASVTFDPVRRRLIVYGGGQAYPQEGSYTLAEVWALNLDGAPVWTSLGSGPHPPGSAGQLAYYDPVRDRLVVTGGYYENGSTISHAYDNTLWATGLQGTPSWTTLPSSTVQPSIERLIYDTNRDRLLAFGGIGAYASVWSRPAADSGQWTLLGSVGPGALVPGPIVFDSYQDMALVLFTAPSAGVPVQAWALAFGSPHITVSLVAATTSSVDLVWRSPTAAGRLADVERRPVIGAWSRIGQASFDARGRAEMFDNDVVPGARYAYRLSLGNGEVTQLTDSVWVEIPGTPQLELRGARPNPAVHGLVAEFSLPAAGPARIEVFDVRGRRILSRDVGSLGPGAHTVSLAPDAALPPGVYLLRLELAGHSVTARAVVIR